MKGDGERGISCKSDHSEMSPQVALMTTTECGRVKCRDAAAAAAAAVTVAVAVAPAPLYSSSCGCCCCCLSHSSPVAFKYPLHLLAQSFQIHNICNNERICVQAAAFYDDHSLACISSYTLYERSNKKA